MYLEDVTLNTIQHIIIHPEDITIYLIWDTQVKYYMKEIVHEIEELLQRPNNRQLFISTRYNVLISTYRLNNQITAYKMIVSPRLLT